MAQVLHEFLCLGDRFSTRYGEYVIVGVERGGYEAQRISDADGKQVEQLDQPVEEFDFYDFDLGSCWLNQRK